MEENKKETKLAEEKKTEVKKVEVKGEPKKEEKKETKTNTKKAETKKTNNYMITIGVAIAVVVVIAVIACMLFVKDSPKKVVEQAFTELKTGAFAQEMLSGLVQGEDGLNGEAQKLLFEKLEWKIIKETEEGEKATVEVEVTNKDFKTIIGNYMQKAIKAAFSGQTVNEEEMTNYLIEELKNEEVQTVTNTQSITLEKKNGRWEIVEEDNFANCVLPGLNEAVSAFN